MASFGCYDNFDVIATRIITNFHLYLIRLWWQFFQMFVYGVVVYAQKKLHRYWPWKTVSSHFHMLVRPMLLHRMALVSVRLFCKNLGNLQEFFGQIVYRPPWQKIARTPMPISVRKHSILINKTTFSDVPTVLDTKSCLEFSIYF